MTASPFGLTKSVAAILSALQIQGSTLVVCEGAARDVLLASRNIPGVELTTGSEVNAYQVLRHGKLVFTRPAFTRVEQRLQ